jgi:hypothetical protein
MEDFVLLKTALHSHCVSTDYIGEHKKNIRSKSWGGGGGIERKIIFSEAVMQLRLLRDCIHINKPYMKLR